MGIRSLFGSLRGKIIGKNLKIVFPEGSDERVLRVVKQQLRRHNLHVVMRAVVLTASCQIILIRVGALRL